MMLLLRNAGVSDIYDDNDNDDTYDENDAIDHDADDSADNAKD